MAALSKTDKSRLTYAYRIAEANAGEDYPRQSLGAVLIKAGSVLSVGWNKSRCNPNNVDRPLMDASRHAEEEALSRAGDPTGAILYVARARRDGGFGMALPCPRCAPQIEAAGIKRVVFSVDSVDEIEGSFCAPNLIPMIHKGGKIHD